MLSAIVNITPTVRPAPIIDDGYYRRKGIMLGEGNLARAYQGAPIAITVEGATF